MAFGVGSKAFLRKGGRPATTRESTGAKVWRIESAGDDGKPTGVFHDGIKSSQMRNPKDGDFPGETNDSGARKEKPVTTTAKSKKSKPVPWRSSEAKKMLHADLVEGRIPLEDDGTMSDLETFEQRPEHVEHGHHHFPARLKGLRKSAHDNEERAAIDQRAFDAFVKNNKKATHSEHGYPEWEGSDAQRLLKRDMENDKHKTMDPIDLWHEADECQEFPLKVFREHICQATRTKKFLH